MLDLFADARLNHHTRLSSGVLADACGETLRSFFAERRELYRQRRKVPMPLAISAEMSAAMPSPDFGEAAAPLIPAGETEEIEIEPPR